MTGYLVDTNVISEVIKPGPNPRAVDWLRHTDPPLLFASVITVGESVSASRRLRPGAAVMSWKRG